jgi:hypothetical protein
LSGGTSSASGDPLRRYSCPSKEPARTPSSLLRRLEVFVPDEFDPGQFEFLETAGNQSLDC